MGCIVVYELKFYIVASRQIHSTIKEKLTKNQVGHIFVKKLLLFIRSNTFEKWGKWLLFKKPQS